MKKRYETILFDMDGTLCDSFRGIVDSLQQALEEFSYPLVPASWQHEVIGPPILDSLRRHGVKEEDLEPIVLRYRAIYGDQGLYKNVMYDGIQALLDRLKADGRKIAIASAKPDPHIKKVVERWGNGSSFDVISGTTIGPVQESKTEIIHNALERLGISKDEQADVLMIGDRYYDLVGAKNNGIDAVGVLYGFGTREELSQYDALFLADKVSDLESFLF